MDGNNEFLLGAELVRQRVGLLEPHGDTGRGDGFACGLFDAPVWLTALAAISMLAYWTVTRNSVLNRLRGATWATVMTLGFVTIISIQVGAYWLGLVAGEII
jgi:hypothetical protein